MKFARAAALSLLWMLSAQAPAAALDGDGVIAAVDAHEDGYVDLTADVTMTLIDAEGDRSVRHLRFASQEMEQIGDRRKFLFLQPADIKGTAILIHSLVIEDDRQWIYLPAFKRIKRVSSQNRKTAFVGSEFSYEDLASQEKEKYRNELIGEGDSNGHPCHLVKRTPLLAHSGYSHLVAYVDRETHRYRKVEYFDESDTPVKTLDIGDYRLYNGRFLIAANYSMKNHRTGKSTVMRWDQIHLSTGIPSSEFERVALKRAR